MWLVHVLYNTGVVFILRHASRNVLTPTGLRHALGALHARVQHFFCRDEENAIGRLFPVHNFQLLHQEVNTTVRVLLPHL